MPDQTLSIIERSPAPADAAINDLIAHCNPYLCILPSDLSAVDWTQGRTLIVREGDVQVGVLHLAFSQCAQTGEATACIDVMAVSADSNAFAVAGLLVDTAVGKCGSAGLLTADVDAQDWQVLDFLRARGFVTVNMTEQAAPPRTLHTMQRRVVPAGDCVHADYLRLCDALQEKEMQGKDLEAAVCQLGQDKLAAQRHALMTSETNRQLEQQLATTRQALRETEQLLAQVREEQRLLLAERDQISEELHRLAEESALIPALRSMKLAHLFAKTQNQLVKGSLDDRRRYLSWLLKRSESHEDTDPNTNPLIRLTAPIQALSRQLEQSPLQSAGAYAVSELERIIGQHPSHTMIVLPELADWNIPLFQRPQQLAMAFAQLGVLFVYTTPNGLDKLTAPTLIRDNCLLIRARDTAEVVRLAKACHKRVILDICSPDNLHFDAWIRQWDACEPTILYEYIDEISDQITGKVPPETLERHQAFLRDPNVYVVATADKLYQEVVAARGSSVNCLSSGNGVDCAHFRQADDPALVPPQIREIIDLGRPIIGYFGALANWFDFELLVEAAKQRPNYEFMLIGPVFGTHELPILKKVRRLRNVHLTGTVDYRVLPQVARHFTAATIPFVLNEITESTSPIKLFEYFALGKPVVTTAMRECFKYPVHVARTTDEYVTMLDAAIQEAGDPAAVQRLLDEADANSWLGKARELMALLHISEENA